MSQTRDFVHLHCHSVYSLLDGLNPIKPMVKRAKELGMSSLALTDHGRMSGALEFHLECRKQGIRPILGCEIYLAHATVQEPAGPANPTDHLILLCQNQTGYQNLCRILTIAEKPPYFYSKPRVDLDLLSRHAEGLIASSACVMGPVARHVVEGAIYDRSTKEYVPWSRDIGKAVAYAGKLKEIFGGRFFIEVQDHSANPQDLHRMHPECRHSYDEAMRMEKAFLAHARKVAAEAGVPWLATNDCHFLGPESYRAHDVLVQLSTKRDGSGSLRSGLDQLYLKSAEEMWQVFGHYPDLLTNTVWVAEQCDVRFEEKGFKIPRFDCVAIGQPSDPKLAMRSLAMEGAGRLYGTNGHFETVPDEVAKRLDFEVETVAKIGVCDYMLIVADFVNWARRQGIRVGPARGSAGGSVLSYCLGITAIDPIRHGLIFERFMNPERVSMPDIDVDFPPERVQEVIDYVRDKYGDEYVARVATFQTLDTKAALQRVAIDIYGQDRREIFTLTKSLPEKQGHFGTPLAELRETHKGLRDWVARNPAERNEILDVVAQIVGVKQAASAHAAGVLVGDKPLRAYVPLMVGSSERKARDFDAIMHTQVPMDNLEELGLLKIDFLAVDSLSAIDTCLRYVKRTQGIDFEFPIDRDEGYDDPDVYRLVQQGRTAGVFQIDSEGMRRVCMLLRPETYDQLYAILALHRPGPMDMVDEKTGLTMEETFIHRRRGWQEVSYLMPEIAPVLEPTFGVLVYQEQIIQIAQVVCGYSGAQADVLRKGVGKKVPEVIAKEKGKFIPAAVAKGHDPAVVERLWSEIETFARYGFNKSHTVGYSVLTYQTAYLKAHFRLEYMAALLTIKADNDRFVRKYVDECARLGIRVLGPDINRSQPGWVPEEGAIRFGLRSIMGIDAAASKLVQVRESLPGQAFGDFRSTIDLLHAEGFKQADMDTLVRAGACDHWGRRLAMRSALADRWKILDKRRKKPQKAVQLFSETIEGLGEGPDMRDEDRQTDHVALLAGCYDVDLAPAGTDVITIRMVARDRESLLAAVDLAQRHRGSTPLHVGLPLASGHRAWLQAAKVRDSAEFRTALEETGCTPA